MDPGSKNLLKVIKFDSPLEQGWELKEGHGQVQFLPCGNSDYGARIDSKQGFCMEYKVGVLYQECKAIGFFVRSESDLKFYAHIRVHNQSGEVLQDLIKLYCHPGEGSYPERHQQYPNEYEVHVPVEQLEKGWFLWKIDLPWQIRQVAKIRNEEWEFDRLLWLELKEEDGVKIDADRIELYKESPWEIQIFLCYAREDEERVNNLYQKLFDEGFKPWMDKKDILPGEQWEFCIPRAIRRSDFFLACLSANSVNKRGVLQKEIKEALDIWREKLDSDIYLIPVRLEDCVVPESLGGFQWVNLFERDSWTRLVKAIQVGMKRRAEVIRPIVQESTPPFEPYPPAHERLSPRTEMAIPEEGHEQVSKGQQVDQEEVKHLADLLSVHRRNLRDLEIRRAQKGIDVDIKTLREIEHEQEEIARFEQLLKLCEIKDAGDRLLRDDDDWPPEIREKEFGVRKERVRAARELGQYDKEPYKQESRIYLLKGIDNELATDRDGVVQVEIAKALRKVGDLRAIPALLKLREREEKKKHEDYQKKREGKEKKFYEPAYNAVCAALKDLVNRYN